jgi:DNA-directed RNA polymerase subunit RPC12/RpoP
LVRVDTHEFVRKDLTGKVVLAHVSASVVKVRFEFANVRAWMLLRFVDGWMESNLIRVATIVRALGVKGEGIERLPRPRPSRVRSTPSEPPSSPPAEMASALGPSAKACAKCGHAAESQVIQCEKCGSGIFDSPKTPRETRTSLPSADIVRNQSKIIRTIREGTGEDARRLIEQENLNINGSYQGGMTLLCYAAGAKGKWRLTEWMINRGANVAQGNDKNQTPLHLAAAYGNLQTVEILLRYGAPVNALDDRGLTPMDIAEAAHHPDVMTLLLSHGGRITMSGR